MNNTRQEIINSIHSTNKFYEWEWLEAQSDEILLTLSHPLDRDEYAYRLKQEYKNSGNDE